MPSANCLATGSWPREGVTSGRLTCLCQGQGEASLCIIPNPLPLFSLEKITCFSLFTDHFLPSPVICSRGVNPACGPEAAIAQIIRDVLGGGDYFLGQGWQLGHPGDRQDPLGGSDGNEILIVCDEKKQPLGAGDGQCRWEGGLVGAAHQSVRGPGAGHRGAATCWHQSQLQCGEYSREHALTLLLGLCTFLSGIQVPWRMLVLRAMYLDHCKLAGPVGMS